MKNKSSFINYIGILFGLISLGLIIFSVLYFTQVRSVHRLKRHHLWINHPFSPWERIEENKRLDRDFETLEINNFSGSIEIRTWDRDYTYIIYKKRGPRPEEISVKITEDGKSLFIKPEYVNNLAKTTGSVSFEVSIPENIQSISAKSISGSISLSNMSRDTDQELKTVSGSIETDNSKDLYAKTISGSIRFRFSGKRLLANTVSGRIEGDVLDIDPSGSLDMSSVSGSVHIKAYDDFSADLKLNSVSGTVSCEFPILVSYKKRNHLEGKVAEGSIPVKINTTSGSIKIEKP